MGLVADLVLREYDRRATAQDLERERARRRAALAEAAGLEELRSVAQPGGGPVDVSAPGSELSVPLPQPEYGPQERLQRSFALQQAGLDERNLAAARTDQTKLDLFVDELQRMREGLGNPQAANFLLGNDVSPFRSSGGTVYNRYGGSISDESSAVQARAGASRAQAGASRAQAGAHRAQAGAYRAQAAQRAQLARRYGAETEDQRLRNESLEEAFAQIQDPLIRADVANKREVAETERVKRRDRSTGRVEYMDAVRSPDGTFRYAPSRDESGRVVEPPADADNAPAAMRMARRAEEVFGMSPQEALRWAKGRAEQTDAGLREDITKRLINANYGTYLNNPEQLTAKVNELMEIARPGSTAEGPRAGRAFGDASTRSAFDAGATDRAGSDRSPEAQDAKARAQSEGYERLGRWVPGEGWEVLDDQGELIGYYY